MINKYVVSPVKRPSMSHRVKRPTQTGFSSPATHYSEPRIDLNEVLIKNKNSTFYVRLADDSFVDYGICRNDVLIVDKSITAQTGYLALVMTDGEFKVERIKEETTYEVWGIITHIIKSVLS